MYMPIPNRLVRMCCLWDCHCLSMESQCLLWLSSNTRLDVSSISPTIIFSLSFFSTDSKSCSSALCCTYSITPPAALSSSSFFSSFCMDGRSRPTHKPPCAAALTNTPFIILRPHIMGQQNHNLCCVFSKFCQISTISINLTI